MVVLHVELESLKHGVLRDTLVEISGAETLFHWIGLKKLANKHVNYNIVCALYSKLNPPPQKKKKPIYQTKNSPTGIWLNNFFFFLF